MQHRGKAGEICTIERKVDVEDAVRFDPKIHLLVRVGPRKATDRAFIGVVVEHRRECRKGKEAGNVRLHIMHALGIAWELAVLSYRRNTIIQIQNGRRDRREITKSPAGLAPFFTLHGSHARQ